MLHVVAQRLGWWDVDAMVDAIPKKKLDRWMAVARLCGWGDEWSMASTIATAVHNQMTQFMARAGLKPSDKDLLAYNHFEPDVRTGRERVEVKALTQEQLEAQHRSMEGF